MSNNIRLTELHMVLMNRDDLSPSEADENVKEMKNRINEGEFPEDVLYDYGLETDYIFDVLE